MKRLVVILDRLRTSSAILIRVKPLLTWLIGESHGYRVPADMHNLR
jgi:hypothetical protein